MNSIAHFNISEGDKINFNKLIEPYQIEQKKLKAFGNFLADVWKNYALRTESKKGMILFHFSIFFKITDLYCHRLFYLFNNFSKTPFLEPKNFVNSMLILFHEGFKFKSKFIFKFYDFNENNLITKEDVRLVLTYTPFASSNKYKEDENKDKNPDYLFGYKKQQEIETMLKDVFSEHEHLNYDQFVEVVKTKRSEILILPLMFILNKKPFDNDVIQVYMNELKDTETNNVHEEKKEEAVYIKQFEIKYIFKEACVYLQSNLREEEKHTYESDEDIDEEDENLNIDLTKSKLDKNLINFSKPRRRERRFLKEIEKFGNKNPTEIDKAYHEKEKDDSDREPTSEESNQEKDDKDSNKITGYFYTYRQKLNKFKKLYFSLVSNNYLFIYKNKDMKEHSSFHSLFGFLIQEGEPIEFEEKKYYCFSLVLGDLNVNYYFDDYPIIKKMLEISKKVTGYRDFNDYYSLSKKIGKGKFGNVYKGMHKGTKKEVAIKILNRLNLNYHETEMILNEVEINQLCLHPNIAPLFDYFVDYESIYIVMGLVEGPDLFNYLQMRNFKISERRAKRITKRIVYILHYLRMYGIIHRDLKPENILMTKNTSTADVKLVDFGLAKILGPNETCTEPFGTMGYVAPEVLLGQPYSFEADMWSLGVIAHLMLVGILPYDDEDESVIAKKTIKEPLKFDHPRWADVSKEAKNFVEILLEKDAKKRANIQQIIKHPWLKSSRLSDSSTPQSTESFKGNAGVSFSTVSKIYKVYENVEKVREERKLKSKIKDTSIKNKKSNNDSDSENDNSDNGSSDKNSYGESFTASNVGSLAVKDPEDEY